MFNKTGTNLPNPHETLGVMYYMGTKGIKFDGKKIDENTYKITVSTSKGQVFYVVGKDKKSAERRRGQIKEKAKKYADDIRAKNG